MAVLCSIVTALALAGGFYFGFKVGKTGELPKVEKQTKEEKIVKEKINKEQLKMQKILRNLDSYDGTTRGQEEV